MHQISTWSVHLADILGLVGGGEIGRWYNHTSEEIQSAGAEKLADITSRCHRISRSVGKMYDVSGSWIKEASTWPYRALHASCTFTVFTYVGSQ